LPDGVFAEAAGPSYIAERPPRNLPTFTRREPLEGSDACVNSITFVL
jgi:hypothetical protein